MKGPGIPEGVRPKGQASSSLIIPVWQSSSLGRSDCPLDESKPRLGVLLEKTRPHCSLVSDPTRAFNTRQPSYCSSSAGFFPSLYSCYSDLLRIPLSLPSFTSRGCSLLLQRNNQMSNGRIYRQWVYVLYAHILFFSAARPPKTDSIPTPTFPDNSRGSSLPLIPSPIPLSSVPSVPPFPLTSSKTLQSLSREGKPPHPHLFFQPSISFLFSKTKFELFAHLY